MCFINIATERFLEQAIWKISRLELQMSVAKGERIAN